MKTENPVNSPATTQPALDPPRPFVKPERSAKGDSYLYCATTTIDGIKYARAGHAQTRELAINALRAEAKHSSETTGQDVSVDENDVHFGVDHEFVTKFADAVRENIPVGMTVNDLSPDEPARILHTPLKDLKNQKSELEAGNLADEMR